MARADLKGPQPDLANTGRGNVWSFVPVNSIVNLPSFTILNLVCTKFSLLPGPRLVPGTSSTSTAVLALVLCLCLIRPGPHPKNSIFESSGGRI